MRKKSILITLFGICLLLFGIDLFRAEPCSISSDEKAKIDKVLSTLSDEEKIEIERVFEHLFFFDQFSYPIFGSKPMSIGCLHPIDEMECGWDAWRKIVPFFHFNNIVIRETLLHGRQFIIVANLDQVEKVYVQNKDAFHHTFGNRMTLESLKNCLKEQSPLFHELIQNDLCLGILLGYGRGNSELFSLNQTLSSEEKFPLSPFSAGHPLFYYFSPVMPVYFACDPSSDETKALKKRYNSDRAAILKLAKKDKLFTRMLVLLMSDYYETRNLGKNI
jgi:hypothetical protein